LMIENLDGYDDLDQFLEKMKQKGVPVKNKKRLTLALAEVVRRLHKSGYLHGALFGKHIFVRGNEDFSDIDVRLIDLEYVRWHPNRVLKDLSRLYMRIPGLTTHDAMRFLKNYLKEDGMTSRVRRAAAKITRRVERKTKYHKIKNEKKRKKG
jgi:hypothetical protein